MIDYSRWMPICIGFIIGTFGSQVILIIYNSIQLIRYRIQDRKRKQEESSCTNL